MKYFIVFLLGLIVGAVGGAGYFYTKLDKTNQDLTLAKIEADTAGNARREINDRLEKIKAGLVTAEGKLKEAFTAKEDAEASRKQAIAAKEAAETKAKQAEDDKAAAENALSQAKKNVAQ